MSAVLWSSCLVVVLALVTLELLGRIWIRKRSRYYVFEPNTETRMTLAEGIHPGLAREVVFRTNSEGERGETRAAGSRRGIVLGGSSAECYFLNQEEAWPARLERLLNDATGERAGPPIHVGNLSRSAVDSAALRLIADRMLPQYGMVDFAIVFAGASDVLLWLGSNMKAPVEGGADPARYFAFYREQPLGYHPKNSAIRWVWRRLRAGTRSFPQRAVRESTGKWLLRARAQRTGTAALIHESQDPAAVVDRYRRNLREVLVKARAHARHILVVRQPWFDKETPTDAEARLFWNGGIGDAVNGPLNGFFSEKVISSLMRQIDQATKEIADMEGLPALSLREAVESSFENYYDQFHFTPAGSQKVAAAIRDELVKIIKTAR
jgi:lysophospholipase L1-like esterase